jgi:hypothetical protein
VWVPKVGVSHGQQFEQQRQLAVERRGPEALVDRVEARQP